MPSPGVERMCFNTNRSSSVLAAVKLCTSMGRGHKSRSSIQSPMNRNSQGKDGNKVVRLSYLGCGEWNSTTSTSNIDGHTEPCKTTKHHIMAADSTLKKHPNLFPSDVWLHKIRTLICYCHRGRGASTRTTTSSTLTSYFGCSPLCHQLPNRLQLCHHLWLWCIKK